ncbi:hypothetical protein DEM27_15750 [Metarhizobium album]|uniref:Transposase (putative) YhgA-like domain-containing protein n=1 Tax=Metarhizobium album TaxID=2182425 RepID=A0A2U2DQF0_9HYPH|nr:hypothetical protein [Rhizobium album]PWE55502.1 hypothetical protein DEM27_15750 [Rhizobium album]
MGEYDIRLKDAFGRAGKELGEFLFGEEIVSYDIARLLRGDPREADVMARLKDGGLLHIEFQTHSEPEMPWRMLNYRVAMMERECEWKPPFVPMRQIVLYFGFYKHSMPNALTAEAIRFEYEVHDIRGVIDGGTRVDRSLTFEKNLLIALAAGKTVGTRWIPDFDQWEELVIIAGSLPSKERRSDCLRMAEVFSVLRGAQRHVANLIARYRSMPIDVNISETTFTKEVFDQGDAHGYDRAYHEISDEIEALRSSLKLRLTRSDATDTQAEALATLSFSRLIEMCKLLDGGTAATDALTEMNLISNTSSYD